MYLRGYEQAVRFIVAQDSRCKSLLSYFMYDYYKKEREVITMQEQELKKLIADALESVHDITLLKMVLQFILGLK